MHNFRWFIVNASNAAISEVSRVGSKLPESEMCLCGRSLVGWSRVHLGSPVIGTQQSRRLNVQLYTHSCLCSSISVCSQCTHTQHNHIFCIITNRCTHTHPFNGPLSGTTRVSRYQKGKTNLDFTEARDSEWQWHQLGHMQICTSLQTDNHNSTPPLKVFFTGRMPFLLPNQQRQCTEGTIIPSSQLCEYMIM